MTLFKSLMAAAVIAFALPAWAESTITVTDAYAIAATPMAKAGASFMMITNTGTADDRLIGATTDAAERAETHTHKTDAAGVMQMLHVEEGFVIPAGGSLMLERGGDHLMLLGLTRSLLQDETIVVTLHFEVAGDVTVEIPVDLTRAEMGGEHTGHTMTPAPSN